MDVKSKDELLGKKILILMLEKKNDYMNDDMTIMKTKIAKLNYIETISVKNCEPKTLNTSKSSFIWE